MDSTSATVDFFLSPSRDTEAAQSLFWRALRQGALPLRVINADLTPTYPAAIAGLQKLGTLRQRCRHRTARDLNNIVEQDHRASKRRVKAKQGFRPFPAVRRTVASSEAIHQMRKGQVRWLPARDMLLHNRHIERLFGLVRYSHSDRNLPHNRELLLTSLATQPFGRSKERRDW